MLLHEVLMSLDHLQWLKSDLLKKPPNIHRINDGCLCTNELRWTAEAAGKRKLALGYVT